MKVSTILSVAAALIALTSAGITVSYDDLAAKGYRWVTVDGPYACPTNEDLQQAVGRARLLLPGEAGSYWMALDLRFSPTALRSSLSPISQ
jgi:hypothetical protein